MKNKTSTVQVMIFFNEIHPDININSSLGKALNFWDFSLRPICDSSDLLFMLTSKQRFVQKQWHKNIQGNLL